MKKILILTIFIFATLCGSVYAFSDVDPDSELGASVAALTEYGVINGYSDNTFRPDKEITRAEMCKMINILFNFTDVGVNDFLDVSYDDVGTKLVYSPFTTSSFNVLVDGTISRICNLDDPS